MPASTGYLATLGGILRISSLEASFRQSRRCNSLPRKNKRGEVRDKARSSVDGVSASVKLDTSLTAPYGSPSIASWHASGCGVARIQDRAAAERTPGCDRPQRRCVQRGPDREDARPPGAHRPGHPRLVGAPSSRWGVAYRLGLTREARQRRARSSGSLPRYLFGDPRMCSITRIPRRDHPRELARTNSGTKPP